MPEKIGLDLNEALFPGKTLYTLRQTYQKKDASKIIERRSSYMSKWNGQHGSRFTIACRPEVTEDHIVIKGYAKVSESFNQLNLDAYWGQHEHIEGIVDYDAYYMASGGTPEPQPPGSPEPMDPPTQPPLIQWNMTTILIVLAVAVLGYIAYKKFIKKGR